MSEATIEPMDTQCRIDVWDAAAIHFCHSVQYAFGANGSESTNGKKDDSRTSKHTTGACVCQSIAPHVFAISYATLNHTKQWCVFDFEHFVFRIRLLSESAFFNKIIIIIQIEITESLLTIARSTSSKIKLQFGLSP